MWIEDVLEYPAWRMRPTQRFLPDKPAYTAVLQSCACYGAKEVFLRRLTTLSLVFAAFLLAPSAWAWNYRPDPRDPQNCMMRCRQACQTHYTRQCQTRTVWRTECRDYVNWQTQCRDYTRWQTQCRDYTTWQTQCRNYRTLQTRCAQYPAVRQRCLRLGWHTAFCRNYHHMRTQCREYVTLQRRCTQVPQQNRRCSQIPQRHQHCARVPQRHRRCANVPQQQQICFNVPKTYCNNQCQTRCQQPAPPPVAPPPVSPAPAIHPRCAKFYHRWQRYRHRYVDSGHPKHRRKAKKNKRRYFRCLEWVRNHPNDEGDDF